MHGKTAGIVLTLVLLSGFVGAVNPEELARAKALIDSKTPCSSLSADQLEWIGEYVMEQMHPGQAHEWMHRMMGLEEGSDAEKQFHIALANQVYCGSTTTWNGGLGGMMGGGMMRMMYASGLAAPSGMMGNGGYGWNNMMGGWTPWLWGLNDFLLTLLLAGLVVGVFLWILKQWQELKASKRK